MILNKVKDLLDIGLEKISKSYKDIRVCELGDQKAPWDSSKTGKNLLLKRGVIEHVSIDLNGRRGALRKDLRIILDDWHNYFDMVTNFGTTEHVDNQYAVFANIHNFVKMGGCMIHTVPPVGQWERHCPYRYHYNFFKTLAKYNNYDLVFEEVRNVDRTKPNRDLICSILIKTKNEEFMSEFDFGNMGEIKYGK